MIRPRPGQQVNCKAIWGKIRPLCTPRNPSRITREERAMAVIRQDDFIQSIADSLQYISYYHPLDFIQAVHEAYQREESPAAKAAMAQILVNSRMCAEGHRPICHDTGICTVFLKVGMCVRWEAKISVTDMVKEVLSLYYLNP